MECLLSFPFLFLAHVFYLYTFLISVGVRIYRGYRFTLGVFPNLYYLIYLVFCLLVLEIQDITLLLWLAWNLPWLTWLTLNSQAAVSLLECWWTILSYLPLFFEAGFLPDFWNSLICQGRIASEFCFLLLAACHRAQLFMSAFGDLKLDPQVWSGSIFQLCYILNLCWFYNW